MPTAEPAIEARDLVREFRKGPRAVDGIDLRGEPVHVALAEAVALALVALFAMWALRGLGSAEAAG